MKDVAAGLASLGRGEDSVLIHMTPGEVAGLQQLAMAHGGSLTTNPHTGLPEAGFLKNLLPTVLGIGATMLSGGAITPLMAGLGVGALQAARTGDLGKGLMAGLGAFGGGHLGGMLGGAGAASTAAPAAMTGVGGPGSMAASTALQGGQGLAASPGALLSPELIGASGAAMPAGVPGGLGLSYAPGQAAFLGAGASGMPSAALSGAGMAGTGAGLTGSAANLGVNTGAAAPSFLDKSLAWAKANPMMAAGVGAAGLGALGGFEQPGLTSLPGQERSTARLSGPVRRPYDESAPEGYYFTDRGMLQPNYAKGGTTHSVPQLEDGGFVLTKKAVDGLGKGSNERGQRTARAGLGAIPIKGPGTGTSDSIATSIDGVRPAKVSNGEAYVPRKRVKQAGGAKKLYALMRQAENDAKRRAA
jgi:hypothetical protein